MTEPIKNVSRKTAAMLTCMNDWMTAKEIAQASNKARTPTARALVLLIEKGLVEVATVNEGTTKRKFRRSDAGSQFIGVYSPREVAKPVAKAAPTGNNPFDWRNFKQPYPWQEDPYPNQHRETSEKATFWI